MVLLLLSLKVLIVRVLYEKRKQKGFTLVEIIVVLVILAAIAVPSVLGYVEQAK